MVTTARQQWDEFRRIVKKQGRRYGGKYIAMINREVVAVGKDEYAVYKKAARKLTAKQPIGLYYVPTKKDLMVLLWNILTSK